MKISPLPFALLLVCTMALRAQTPSPTPAAPRFRTLGLDAAASDLCYSLKDKDVPVSIVSDSRSEFYPVPPANPVVFYRVEKLPDATVKRIPVAQADLTSGGPMPLVIFSADPALPGKLRVDVLKDDLKTFPEGSFRILNRDQFELGALVAKQPTIVPASADRVVDFKPGDGQKTVFFQIYRNEKNDHRLLYSNNWALVPGLRTLVVVPPALPPQTRPNVRRIAESASMLTAPAVPSPPPQ